MTANLRSWKKSRKLMEFEELIRVPTMILSGGQTGKNISMITVNNAYAHFFATGKCTSLMNVSLIAKNN